MRLIFRRYSICSHCMLYARMQCRDSLGILERRVQELNTHALVSDAVAANQKEFTRLVSESLAYSWENGRCPIINHHTGAGTATT